MYWQRWIQLTEAYRISDEEIAHREHGKANMLHHWLCYRWHVCVKRLMWLSWFYETQEGLSFFLIFKNMKIHLFNKLQNQSKASLYIMHVSHSGSKYGNECDKFWRFFVNLHDKFELSSAHVCRSDFFRNRKICRNNSIFKMFEDILSWKWCRACMLYR